MTLRRNSDKKKKLKMPSLCNCTLSSSPDRDECQYWTSFAEKPFICGDRLQVYKGKLNGKGPRGGDFSMVKVFGDKPGTETRCQTEVLKVQTACDLLRRFKALCHMSARRVRFTQLQIAPMDECSMLNKVFSNKRRPSPGEWILLEEMIPEKGLVSFVDSRGRLQRQRAVSGSSMGLTFQPGGSGGSCSLDSRQLLEAFVHFSHQSSGGALVVCGLEGQEDEEGRLLVKTPVIHSRSRQYGETDLGPQGIRDVMSQHSCNPLCRKVTGLRACRSASELNLSPPSPQSPVSPPPYSREPPLPSAPYEPEVMFPMDPFPGRRPSFPSAPPYDPADLLLFNFQLSQDVFCVPSTQMEQLRELVRMTFTAKVPDEPPPPYQQLV